MPDETNRLTDIDVAEVSLVGKPANKRSFLVFKSEEGGNKQMADFTLSESLMAVLQKEAENEADVMAILEKADISQEAKDAMRNALRLMYEFRDEVPEEFLNRMAGYAGVSIREIANAGNRRNNPDHYDDKNKNKSKAKKGLDGYPEPVKKEDGSFDLSGITEEQQPIIEALWKQAEKSELLEKQLKEEQDQRLVKQFIEKAQSFDNLPIQASEIGPVFKAIAEKAPKEFEQIDSLLKAVDEALAQSKLYKEVGSNHQGASNAWDKVEQMAAGIVQKDESISKEQAITRVLEQNPQLYSEYLAEKR